MLMASIDPVDYASKVGVNFYEDQKEMARAMFEAAKKKGVVFVAQGPTGMGKTYCIAAVTAALADLDKKVCIAVPTYAHLETVAAIHLKKLGIKFARLRGVTHLDKSEGCPLKGGKLPSPLFCGGSDYGPDKESCEKIDCAMRRDHEEAQKLQVVLTVYHKLLANPRLIELFDVIFFDESHSLEPALRDVRTSHLKLEYLELLSSVLPDHAKFLQSVQNELEQLSELPPTLIDLPTSYIQSRIRDPLREALEKVRKEIETLEIQNRVEIDPKIIEAYYALEHSVYAFTNVEAYRYVRTGRNTILAIPQEITFAPAYAPKLGIDRSIALVSATVENAKLHAKDAGFPYHKLTPPIQIDIDKAERLKRRFRKRPIFGLIDGPILRKDPSDIDTYYSARKEANEIILKIVSVVHKPTLILCRSKDDQSSIEKTLAKTTNIQRRLYSLREEDEALNVDTLTEKINSEIRKGRNIVLASASSRLWEGVNIEELRFLVVDSLPYPSPELGERRQPGPWKTSHTFRFMIRRLQQGIGRLIRKDGDYGVATVIDGRFNAHWKTLSSELPLYMREPLEFVRQKELTTKIKATFDKIEK